MLPAEELGLSPDRARTFFGNFMEGVINLRRSRFCAWDPAHIMDARNKAVGTPYEDALWNRYICTEFGLAGTRKELYLGPLEALSAVSTDRNRIRIYQRDDLILKRELTEEEARSSSLWLRFADGDQNRLDRYVENTFRRGKNRYDLDQMMGIHFQEEPDFFLRMVALNAGDDTGKGSAVGAGERSIHFLFAYLVGERS